MLLQGDMQQLRDKLVIAERTAKSEAQLKVIIWLLRGLFFSNFAICFLLLVNVEHSLFFVGKISFTTKSARSEFERIFFW